MENRPKDPCIQFRNVLRGKSKQLDALNPQGSDRFQLYLNVESIPELIAALEAQMGNERGVNIDLHIKKRENRQNGNVFDSGFCFVKAVQEPQANGGRGTAGPTRFVPKGSPSAATLDRTSKVKRELESE